MKNNNGEVFGTLTIMKEDAKVNGMRRVICKCACGEIKSFYMGNLRWGHTQSCGCLRMVGLSERNTTHGSSPARLYRVWANMKTRCSNPKSSSYEFYGAKGVQVCDEWAADFVSFRHWALDNGYSGDLSIDRIDGTKGYNPDNCRWADDIMQSRNRDYAWFIEINGEVRHAKDWCEKFGVVYKTAHTRKQRGWDERDAVSTPSRKDPDEYWRIDDATYKAPSSPASPFNPNTNAPAG